MHLRNLLIPLLGLALASAVCGKAKPKVAPAPDTGAPAPSPPPARPPAPPPTDRSGDAAAMAERARAELLRELQNPIHFDYDRDEIRSSDAALLDRKAAILLANPTLRIKIAGHADERGSDEYNLVLGNKRAAAAKRYLAAKGVDGSRIEIISFGEERPVDPASNEEAWAKNRRDEFEILSGADKLVSPQ